MGTFMGHVLPGSYFLGFSIWWFLRIMHDFYSRPGSYMNTVGKTCCCRRGCCIRTHVEAITIIVVTVIAGAIEIYTGWTGATVIPGNQQHLTMYTAFCLGAVTELLMHHKLKFIPKKADYMAMIMALVVEMVLFAFHLHGRTKMDKHIHMLLVYSIMGCIVASGLEMHFEKSVQAAIARCYFFMLQGTWFIQVGYILYNPIPGAEPWDGDDPESVMITTLIFAWHLIGCTIGASPGAAFVTRNKTFIFKIVGMISISALAYACCYRNKSKRFHRRGVLTYKRNDEESMELTGNNSAEEEEEDSLMTTSTGSHH